MPLRFYNIRSGEELVAETEPQIAALWGSSDRGPNVNQGQDMGWRFAPEVVVEMNSIRADSSKIQEIANRFNIMFEDVSETDIMTWISNKTELAVAPVAKADDYADSYAKTVRDLEAERKKADTKADAETTTETTTETLANLEKRVALEERLAAAKAKTETVVDATSTSSKK
jgi:hypothetical protein